MNVGIGEILILLIVGLIVFGPNRLPEIARSVGKAVRTFQRETSRAMDELRSVTSDAGVVDRAPAGRASKRQEGADAPADGAAPAPASPAATGAAADQPRPAAEPGPSSEDT